MYPMNTASILTNMGYINLVDFSFGVLNETTTALAWYSTEPQPTEQEVIDASEATETAAKQKSMLDEGDKLTERDQARVVVGAEHIIPNRSDHDTWMAALYADYDGGVVATHKPPATQRQYLSIVGEQSDPFTFTRFNDQWGYRWRLDLTRDDVNNLSIGIYTSTGGYLYTIGALIDNGDGTYYGECPEGQADATPEDVYFIWLLGSAHISDLEVYKGEDDTYSGRVKSDTEYDL